MSGGDVETPGEARGAVARRPGGAGAWRGARGGLAPGDAGVCVERLGARRYGAGSVHWSRRGTLDKVLLFLNVFVVHERGL